MLLVVPTAYWIRLKLPRLRPVVEFITLLPLVIPAIVIVFGYLRLYNSSSWLPLTASARATDLLLVFGYVTLALPYMYRAVDTGLRAIDVRTLTEAAQSLGAGWPTILFRVILPNVRAAVLSGAFLTFAIVIGEFTMASLLDRPGLRPLPAEDRRQPRLRAVGAADHRLRRHLGLHGPDQPLRPRRRGHGAGRQR